jgi:hypothetical protein
VSLLTNVLVKKQSRKHQRLLAVLTLTTPVFPEDEVPVVKATVPLVPSLEDTITEPSDESLCTATFAACSVV